MVGPVVSDPGHGLPKRSGLTTEAKLPVEEEMAIRAPAARWLALCRDGET